MLLFNRCEHILLKVNWETFIPPAEPEFIFCLLVISVTALQNGRAIWFGIESRLEKP